MTTPGFIGLKLQKSGSGSMRHHFHTWIGHHSVHTLNQLRIFGSSFIQDLGEHLMQQWMEINLATLQRLNKTIPQQMHGAIKAKGSPVKYKSV